MYATIDIGQPKFGVGDTVLLHLDMNGLSEEIARYNNTTAVVVDVYGFYYGEFHANGALKHIINQGWKYKVNMYDGTTWTFDVMWGSMSLVEET